MCPNFKCWVPYNLLILNSRKRIVWQEVYLEQRTMELCWISWFEKTQDYLQFREFYF